MCGRYTLGQRSAKKFEELLGAEMPQVSPRYNVCPGQDNPVIHRGQAASSDLACGFLRWGFVPNWLKEPEVKAPINARMETVLEKPYFRDAYRDRRCLVPADGYYEWQQVGKTKIPHFIKRGGEAFAFAGLWDAREETTGVPTLSYAIITTKAAESIRFIHHRMPVVLPQRHWEAWLDYATPTAILPAILEDALTGFDSHTVSSLVNSRQNEGPELITSVKRSLQEEFDFI